MCGRYALGLPPSRIRRQMQESNMPSQDAPDDDEIRQTYNFAPGYYGLVYRADAPDRGGMSSSQAQQQQQAIEDAGDLPTDTEIKGEMEGDSVNLPTDAEVHSEIASPSAGEPVYRLQKMKWGLVPFWTKRNPDYGSMMRVCLINSAGFRLELHGGMWNTMKQRKRCVVLAQGFYEWLKKDGGKVKIPHFVKRKDGQLMCFAGLWDCAKFEDAEDKLYTYTIITTDPNKQLSFLHDRMPVILENGSADMFTWLDAGRSEWSRDLQSLLKPFEGELECYPVSQEVGKVGNDSPSFIVPIDSSENKQNIANFFGGQKKLAATEQQAKAADKAQHDIQGMNNIIERNEDETRATTNKDQGENNAPLPAPTGIKRPASPTTPEKVPNAKAQKNAPATSRQSPITPVSSKRSKSSTTNTSASKSLPTKAEGSKKITNFFGK